MSQTVLARTGKLMDVRSWPFQDKMVRTKSQRNCFFEIILHFWMTPCNFEGLCLQHAAEQCMQKSPNIKWNNWLKCVPKSSQNLSEIDPGRGLEVTWEPPLKQGASKTSLLMILAPFWDPSWDNVGFILGIMLLNMFWGSSWAPFSSIWASF